MLGPRMEVVVVLFVCIFCENCLLTFNAVLNVVIIADQKTVNECK